MAALPVIRNQNILQLFGIRNSVFNCGNDISGWIQGETLDNRLNGGNRDQDLSPVSFVQTT